MPRRANLVDVANNNWTDQRRHSGVTVTSFNAVDKSGRLRSVHRAGAARRAGKLADSRARCPTPTPISFRLTTHSCPARRASPPTRPSPISTGTSAPRTSWRPSTTTSTIPRVRPTLTPTSPASRRTWTPARRWGPSITCRPSAQASASPRPWAFSARKCTPPTIRPSAPTSVGMVRRIRQLFSRHHHQRCHRRRRTTLAGPTRPAGRSTAASRLRWPSGPNAEYQGANTGVFQNRIMPSGTAIWAKGRHSVSLRRQLVLHPAEYARPSHRHGQCGYAGLCHLRQQLGHALLHAELFTATTFLQGNANRYYRANETGLFVQDKFQMTPTLSITLGVRYDWDGGLTEKYGNIFNFDPSQYSYDAASDTITSSGFIIAGNNANGTQGVSKTTLTGRQWGIAPRLGFAWQPSMFHSKVRGPRRRRLLLRPRRALHLSLARLCGRRNRRRSLRHPPRPSPSSASSIARIAPPTTPPTRPIFTCITFPSAAANGLTVHQSTTRNTTCPRPGAHARRAALQSQSLRHRQLPAQCRGDYRRHRLQQQQRSAVHSRRLQPRQQAALQHEFHAQHPVPAAQRPHVRDRLRGQSRPPPGDSRAL